MIDKFGNTLAIGDTVVYFLTGYSPTAHIGLIIKMGSLVTLRSDKGREIRRSPHTLIHYTGIAHGL